VVYAAYDPELDRKVALKLLLPRAGGVADTGARTRLVREAQALAKLSHPNVVAVHDVGTHGDSVWIAMEFVAGETLTAWAKGRPRAWSEILPILIDVARGVTAAHMAGLVHRDLKPDNVMIGRDGRIRVMDFGLAHGRGPGAEEPALASTFVDVAGADLERAALALRLTAEGAIQGTPAYMAPEQWQGQEAEPATDQFGWSVMAWELLFGERPFTGETMMSLAAAVLSGHHRPPPRGRHVPGWLREVIERAMAIEPGRRWPTMAALLTALQRGKSRARVRAGATVAVGFTLLGAGAEGYRRWDIAQRVAACEVAGSEINGAWNDDSRQRLREAFAATGISYAGAAADKVMPWLDERAAGWKRARVEVCLNADVRALWAEDLEERAMWCLVERHMDLASLVDEFGRANATTVQKAVAAAASLRTVDTCLNEHILWRQPIPPSEGGEVMQEVRAGLSRAQSLGLAGNYEEALTASVHAREQAESALDWPPLLAHANAVEGYVREKMGAYEEAEAASRKAYFLAAASGAWDVAGRTAVDLIYTVGYREARYVDGRMWAQHAEVALAHAGDRAGLAEAQRLNNLAAIQLETGEYVEAQTSLEGTLRIREQALGPGHPDVAKVLSNLGSVYQATGAYAEAQALYERSLAIREQVLGPSHPDVVNSLQNLATVHLATGAYAEAQALNERALAIREEALGPGHPDVATTLNNLAVVHEAVGAHAKARELYERALAIQEKAVGPEHPDVATALNNLAGIHTAAGEYAEAQSLLQRALTIREQVLGPGHIEVAGTLNNLANIQAGMGMHSQAEALYERALNIQEQAFGPDHPHIAVTLDNLAGEYTAEERPRDALPILERAVAIYEANKGRQPGEMRAYYHLAEALVATGGDLGRALALGRKARDGIYESGAPRSQELAEIERWVEMYEGKQ